MRYLNASFIIMLFLISAPLYAGSHPVEYIGDKVYIVDRTGERWDVTHAVNKYNMDPREFNYGLGRHAFVPLVYPNHLSEKPQFADFRVFATLYRGHARTYARSSLVRHETIFDRFDDQEVFVAYCVLADLAGIYSRVLDGKLLTLVASGWTYFNGHHDTFVLYDRESGSLWFPFDGLPYFVSIGGEHEDRKLMQVGQITRTTYYQFKALHPSATYAQ